MQARLRIPNVDPVNGKVWVLALFYKSNTSVDFDLTVRRLAPLRCRLCDGGHGPFHWNVDCPNYQDLYDDHDGVWKSTLLVLDNGQRVPIGTSWYYKPKRVTIEEAERFGLTF